MTDVLVTGSLDRGSGFRAPAPPAAGVTAAGWDASGVEIDSDTVQVLAVAAGGRVD